MGDAHGRGLRDVGRLFTDPLLHRRSLEQRQNALQRCSLHKAPQAWTDLAEKMLSFAITETRRDFSQI